MRVKRCIEGHPLHLTLHDAAQIMMEGKGAAKKIPGKIITPIFKELFLREHQGLNGRKNKNIAMNTGTLEIFKN